jgi:hypothetical protein
MKVLPHCPSVGYDWSFFGPLPPEYLAQLMRKKKLPNPPAPQPDPRANAIAENIKKRAAERAPRLALLQSIAKERGTVVLSYVTATRGIVGAQIGYDVVRLFREILGQAGRVKKIDLVLITRGGNVLTPLRLMSLLREFGDEVRVLIPYMAHSAGTLIALGADEIVMGAMGELGPVDPSVSNMFNPILETADIQGSTQPKPRPRIPISVEDVTSYISFAKVNAGLDPDGMSEAYTALTSKVHPLALGNILRNHNLIRHLARTLLAMHMKAESDKEKVDSIVKKLTEELYSHDYTITRDEAGQLGLKVAKPSDQVEKDLWELYKAYEQSLGIDRQVNLSQELGAEKQKYLCFDVAMLENEKVAYAFCTKGTGLRKGANDFEFAAESQAWDT